MLFSFEPHYNENVDAFLSKEAYREIQVLRLTLGQKPQDGLLLGHRCGPRYFLERTWPTLQGFFAGPEKYWQLVQAFEGRVIGFFSYQPSRQRLRPILQPLGCGHILLEIFPQKKSSLALKCFLIDFNGSFFLSPCPLQIETKRQK